MAAGTIESKSGWSAPGSLPRRNFAVYKARAVPRTYLVVSRSVEPLDPVPEAELFNPVESFAALADEIARATVATQRPVTVTLRVHGYNTEARSFEKEVIHDSDPALLATKRELLRGRGKRSAVETFRPGSRFYIGYRWHSEGVMSPESWRDAAWAVVSTPAIGVFLWLIPLIAIALFWSTWRHSAPMAPWQLTQPLLQGVRWMLGPYREVSFVGLALGAAGILLTLRLATYARDRYRAIHYGVPDLGEFMRCLEERLADLLEPTALHDRVHVDVVGHSMGALVLINAIRVMSDYFVSPGDTKFELLGKHSTFRINKMILCAPDIPVAMATTDHNNYLLSALRRVKEMHIFSSDRDIILKWLSVVGNWTSEPRHDMAGRKLGNVVLVRNPLARPGAGARVDQRTAWQYQPVTRPVARNFPIYQRDPSDEQGDLEVIHFYDCTLSESLSGTLAYYVITTGTLFAGLWLIGRFAPIGVHWLSTILGAALGLGFICRLLWPFLRDYGILGCWCGFWADVPTALIALTPWANWNPHGGYFTFGHAPRQRIADLLADAPARLPGEKVIRYQSIGLVV